MSPKAVNAVVTLDRYINIGTACSDLPDLQRAFLCPNGMPTVFGVAS